MKRQWHEILAACLALSIIFQPGITFAADLRIDPTAPVSSQPELTTAANGTPIVNISKPTADGVSHNLFERYNVDAEGLILNNSTGLVPTELGGYVLANPNLHGGSARLILNEISGTDPTRLEGYTEIAGPAADLIIANPNGISINGGGFINTPRVTLATGESEWQNGIFSGLRVERGDLRIEGDGLNAGNIDQLDLYARAIAVNADLWARRLALVTGRNRITENGTAVEPLSDSATTSTPLFALDSSAIGGMYADRISLLGTEAGVGVRIAGDMAASVDNVVLTTAGRLELESRLSGQRGVQIAADTVNVNSGGEVLSGLDLDLSTTVLRNSGSLIAAGSSSLSVKGQLINQDGLLFAFDNMTIYGADPESAVTSVLNESGRIETWQGDLTIHADQLFNHSREPVIESQPYIIEEDWAYPTTEDRTQTIEEGTNDHLIKEDLTPASIRSGHDMFIEAGTLINTYSSISAGNDLLLVGDLLENTGIDLLHEWTTTFNEELFRMKHTQFHTACKKVWQAEPPVIDGPYAKIIDTVPAIIEAGGDLSASFSSTINNGTLRDAILVDSASLPDNLVVSSDSGDAHLGNLGDLFQTAPDNHPYLIETRPLFADKATFVNSEYLLGLLDYHPETPIKRLGDGLYETMLISEEIRQQTGRQFLDTDATSAAEQYGRLMDAALQAAPELELSVGVALNRDQLASLSHDIVWLVATEVNGEQVLVPHLYLAQINRDNLAKGSRIVATGNVSLITDGSISIAGDVSANEDLALFAGDAVTVQDGDLASGNMTLLVTGGSIISRGGRIQGDDVLLDAGGDITLASRQQTVDNRTGFNTVIGRTADITAEDSLSLSGQSISLSGADLHAENVAIAAEKDLLLSSIAKRSESTLGGGKNFSTASETRQGGSSVTGTTIDMTAGRNLTLQGSHVDASADARLIAGEAMTITSAEEATRASSRTSSSSLLGSRSVEHTSASVRQVESSVTAGGRLDLSAGAVDSSETGHNLAIGGSHIEAGTNLTLSASGNILIGATEESSFASSANRKGSLVGARQDRRSHTESNLKQSELQAGETLLMLAGSDIGVTASDIVAGGNAILIAGENGAGNINLLAGETTVTDTSYHRKSGLDLSLSDGFFSVVGVEKNTHESFAQASTATHIETGGDTILSASNDVNLIGAGLSSGGSLLLGAGRDVNILAASERAGERSTRDEKKFGVAIDSDKDRVGVFVGVQTEREVRTGQNQLTSGSNLAAAESIIVSAGENINQVGSAIAAGHDLQMQAGGSINSLAGIDQATATDYYQQVRVGFATSFQHNIGSAVESAQSIGDSSNLLTGASRSLKTIDAIDRATQPSVELHFGASGFRSETEQTDQTVVTSSLYAGHDLLLEAGDDLTLAGTIAQAEHDILLSGTDVRLLATSGLHDASSDSSSFKAGLTISASKNSASITGGGSGSKAATDSTAGQTVPVRVGAGNNLSVTARNDIELEGSQIQAGNDVNLQAGRRLDIHAAANDSDLLSRSHQFSAEAGLSASVKGQGVQTGLTASVNAGQDRLSRENTSYLNAHIDAGDRLDISVGEDARIEGAVLNAATIHGDIGGDLLIASIKDSGTVDGDRWNAGVSVSSSGANGASLGLGSTSGQKDWITEQTALLARDSLELNVGGHTQLDAAILNAESGDLLLDTGSFAYSDHSGSDTETSYDVSIGVNSSGGGPANAQSGAGADNDKMNGSLDAGYSSHDKRQEVRATIGNGTIIVRNDLETGEDSTTGLNRDLDKAYEITKDESAEYELYASSGAIDRISNPLETSLDWANSTVNYGRNAVAAVKGLDKITAESKVAANFVGFVDAADFGTGLLVGRENYGGLVTQIPVLLSGDVEFYKVVALLKEAEKNGTTDELKEKIRSKLEIEELTEIDINDPKQLEALKGVVKYASVNGMLNTREYALLNAAEQTGAKTYLQIYNPTHGFIGDSLECAWDYTIGGLIRSGVSRDVNHFYEVANDAGLSFNVASHSQGALINYRALDGIDFKTSWKFQFNGAPVSAGDLEQVVTDAGGEFKGSYANYSGVPIIAGRSKNDPISSVIGANAQNIGEFVDGVASFTTVSDPNTSDHSHYLCQGDDFCAGQQPLIDQMKQAPGYVPPRLLKTD